MHKLKKYIMAFSYNKYYAIYKANYIYIFLVKYLHIKMFFKTNIMYKLGELKNLVSL